MNNVTDKVPLLLEPLSLPFAMVPVMVALQDHAVFDSWLAARDFVLDLGMVSPQVVWVKVEQQSSLEKTLANLLIMTKQVSTEQAERITIDNKPIRGVIKVHIRMRDSEISQDMLHELKNQKLISHEQKSGNANDIFHWKDDRWYQDYLLFAFNKEDIQHIESIISNYNYIVTKIET